MSGTSLDGLDIAYCEFKKEGEKYNYYIKYCKTVSYSGKWKSLLTNVVAMNAEEYAQIHVQYGHYIGQQIAKFIQINQLKVDFVASHGHTVFHRPELGFTAQIGDGAAISAECGLPVVCDFRSMDIAYQGQGAPLVPIGDAILFGDFDYCLNIGGIANISFNNNGKRIAFDISPANMALNYFAQKLGYDYDKNGNLAKQGNLNESLFNKLNKLNYYTLPNPKSLGREWFECEFLPQIDEKKLSNNDILSTLTHHIAYQISCVVNNKENQSILVTGGGAKNAFLMELCHYYAPNLNWILLEENIIDYKEALIFAFLGLLRMERKENCLSSVTGAVKNVIGGAVYYNIY